MVILAYGLSYRTAPLAFRERVAFPQEAIADALKDLLGRLPDVQEAVILSTCNRTEIYTAMPADSQAALAAWLCDLRDLDVAELEDSVYRHSNLEAARHLIRVAAGLDSQVLGEPEILGQVKNAWALARAAGTLGITLGKLADSALNTAKKLRSETGVGRNPVSVATAAVTLANRLFTRLSDKQALLIGAGETIERVARHLRAEGVGRITIANRTLENAQALAAHVDAEAVALDALETQLSEHDMVITSTDSDSPIVQLPMAQAAIAQRRHKPIIMIDLAVPRDIAPAVGELPDIYLYSIDDVGRIVAKNRKQRQMQAEAAAPIIDEGASRFFRDWRTRQGQSALLQFRDQAESVRVAETEKAIRNLENGARADVVLAQLGQSLTAKLIHPPTVALRQAIADDRPEVLALLKKLYALD